MDIEYLLFLQNFRNSINNAWTPFMEAVSLFAVTYLVMLPAFIYWCLDKKKGLYTLTTIVVTVALNAVVKLTACIYRPWIRDSRILPAGDAITTATGYSFPSGHTMTATPTYGAMAVVAWKKLRWFSCLCIVMLLLTGFSRNYLGVHTPQDVGVGLILSCLCIYAIHKLFSHLDKHPESTGKWLAAGVLFGIISLIYISVKPYPMDYVDGKLLVDPQRMMRDGFKDIGQLIAFCLACYAEKKWVKFNEAGLTMQGVAISLAGMIPLFFMINYLQSPLVGIFGAHWGALISQAIIISYIVVGWPAVIKFCLQQPKEVPAEAA